ncbi:hypothetical protein L3X38_036855 [Prunus dulcis]|uniref:Uncharacterized protein n=1 Tax=Prunus dulcis TaxID=3755 RepID=A0AAD4V2K2_PRUDU|nr:hypothetical protein L3X38_036855 [Prunus dulcis]
MDHYDHHRQRRDLKHKGRNVVWSRPMDKCLIDALAVQARKSNKIDKRTTVGSEKLQQTENGNTGKGALIFTLINRLWIGRGTDPIEENGGRLSRPVVNLKYPLAIGFGEWVVENISKPKKAAKRL